MVNGLAALMIGLAGSAWGASTETGMSLRPARQADTDAAPAPTPPVDQNPGDNSEPDDEAVALLERLGERDRSIDTLTAGVRLTAIQALQGDMQQRTGRLWLRTDRGEQGDGNTGGTPVPPGGEEEPGSASRATGEKQARSYAVAFEELLIDRRVQAIDEHYVFDGRWMVERHPEEKQFIKREIVPEGATLDPMDLMRDAPFWVSVGDDAERVLANYRAEVLPAADGLTENAQSPELAKLARLVEGCVQLRLTPRESSAGRDDWQSVRIWFDEKLLPRLYVKTEWTGDLQIAELFGVEVNGPVDGAVFDTTTPAAGSGWQVRVSAWRGRAEE